MRVQTPIILALCCCFTGCSVARIVYSRPSQRSTEQHELANALKAQQALEQDVLSDRNTGAHPSANAKARIASRIQMLTALDQPASETPPLVASETPPQKTVTVKSVSAPKRLSSASVREATDDSLIGRESRI
jgi:hypothetical protein